MRTLQELGPVAIEHAAQGKWVFCYTQAGHWFSTSPNTPPDRAYWATTLHKSQRKQSDAERLAVSQLTIGESVTVTKGFHPKHGESKATVVRIA